ncbi:hypothetical protein EYF80_029113 [Liparis tanakae]|uniref:Uncharacterized protein n=1 Tax=Liparis tanakae TaxID=230148 RepID=A0A4Z2H575_9TELE|nr:hypothetical protein EYF80_029113 [Liparis tanakae]
MQLTIRMGTSYSISSWREGLRNRVPSTRGNCSNTGSARWHSAQFTRFLWLALSADRMNLQDDNLFSLAGLGVVLHAHVVGVEFMSRDVGEQLRKVQPPQELHRVRVRAVPRGAAGREPLVEREVEGQRQGDPRPGVAAGRAHRAAASPAESSRDQQVFANSPSRRDPRDPGPPAVGENGNPVGGDCPGEPHGDFCGAPREKAPPAAPLSVEFWRSSDSLRDVVQASHLIPVGVFLQVALAAAAGAEPEGQVVALLGPHVLPALLLVPGARAADAVELHEDGALPLVEALQVHPVAVRAELAVAEHALVVVLLQSDGKLDRVRRQAASCQYYPGGKKATTKDWRQGALQEEEAEA